MGISMSLNVTLPIFSHRLAVDISEDGSEYEVPDDYADVSDVDDFKASEQDLNDLDRLIEGARGTPQGTNQGILITHSRHKTRHHLREEA
jgi:hypothetical protein